MDYKEKYEMALEGIQEILSSGEDSIKMSRLQLRLQGIFPELKESENWIPKEIIKYLKEKGDFRSCWIAWLEKQGEQKPADKVEPKFKVGQTIKKEDFNPRFPIVKIEDGFYYNDMGDHFPFTDQDNWKLVEQNSAWGVEDEDILNTIINHFKIDIECTDEDDMVRWLKSLKDRVQPKQEWSEEDETTRKALINLVEMYYGGCIDKTEKNRLLNFLKSLRPQNWTKEDKERYINCLQRLGTGDPKQPETINSKWFKEHVYHQNRWKPSDEQMKCLDNVKGSDDHNGYVLNTLYNDLKKLKEE